MLNANALTIDYGTHEPVHELIEIITYCVEGVSIEFTRWDEEYVRGPGLYFVVVSGSSVVDFADPMGHNRWPIDDCEMVSEDLNRFYEATNEVALTRDGAIVVSVNGVLLEQMVRFKDLTTEELSRLDGVDQIEYAGWMGERHMSAVDTSARQDVVAAITLSEEDGRVTVFKDGGFQDSPRDRLGGERRAVEE
ncbi:diadenylate cyclase [Halobacteria archaeon AArc-curdl1]|uniref:Diadenylate cyclase n=1 Tax=Natronosalvus hydrolyticus TaxID=2979988 RepID=A0AAP2Z6L7_9EURY|nr:diadenylate cyclase [Halobacteria archaeon AArc-curdl1]